MNLPAAKQWGGGPLAEERGVEGPTPPMKATASSMRASRAQRRAPSLPEALLWRHLRGSPGGIKFRRQHAIGPYVADFYCAAAKMLIEIDGIAHDMGNRPERDETRSQYLRSLDLSVARIAASDVIADPVAIADSIVRLCCSET